MQIKSMALTTALAAAASFIAFQSPLAKASLFVNTTGGTACKASSGPGAQVFYFSNLYAENVSPAVQYLSCQVPNLSENVNDKPEYIEAGYINSSATAHSSTCVLQAGFLGYSYSAVNSAIMTKSMAAGASDGFSFSTSSTPAMPNRPNQFSPYSLSCSVGAGGRVGGMNIPVTGTKA